MLKKLFLICALLLTASAAQAQVYTDDHAGMMVPPPGPARYRLRNAYPAYPVYPAGPVTSPDTVQVGRPEYYYGSPYGYPGTPYGSYPSGTSDSNSAGVLGN